MSGRTDFTLIRNQAIDILYRRLRDSDANALRKRGLNHISEVLEHIEQDTLKSIVSADAAARIGKEVELLAIEAQGRDKAGVVDARGYRLAGFGILLFTLVSLIAIVLWTWAMNVETDTGHDEGNFNKFFISVLFNAIIPVFAVVAGGSFIYSKSKGIGGRMFKFQGRLSVFFLSLWCIAVLVGVSYYALPAAKFRNEIGVMQPYEPRLDVRVSDLFTYTHFLFVIGVTLGIIESRDD